MKYLKRFATCFVVIPICSCLHAQEQIIPRIKFSGDEFADKASAIFAETLQDMRNKIEDGSNPKYPLGFFHTSTEEAGVPQITKICGDGTAVEALLNYQDWDLQKMP